MAEYLIAYGSDFFLRYLADLIRIKTLEYCETWLTETSTFWSSDEILGGTVFCLKCYHNECENPGEYKYDIFDRCGTMDGNPKTAEIWNGFARFKINLQLY